MNAAAIRRTQRLALRASLLECVVLNCAALFLGGLIHIGFALVLTVLGTALVLQRHVDRYAQLRDEAMAQGAWWQNCDDDAKTHEV